MQTVLVTGSAGFIGFHLCNMLLDEGYKVIGIDNLNSYYSTKLKRLRLKEIDNRISKDTEKKNNYFFHKYDLNDYKNLELIYKKYKPSIVIHLAAQAGVRYSIENPDAYLNSNINGFYNILKLSKNFRVNHFLFASSSSVYGLNKSVPFKESDNTDFPISLYAATKKSNELLAFSYSHLFDMAITGLRFFTVYGPFGRPDMAYFKFADKILNRKSIKVYNNGNLERDFTYIDDVVRAISLIMKKIPKKMNDSKTSSNSKFKIYNIGNENPVRLKRFINLLEKHLNKKSKKIFLPMQPGDVKQTFANIDNLKADFKFKIQTDIDEGLGNFVDWYIKHKDLI